MTKNQELDRALSGNALAAKLAVATERLDEARVASAKASRLVGSRYNVWQRLNEEQDRRLVESGALDWEKLLTETFNGSKALYAARNKALAEIGLKASGYYPSTEQTAIQISLKNTDGVDRVLAGLEEVLPFLKPVGKEYQGKGKKNIRIGIMDDDLSESGILSLINRDGKWVIVKNRYGTESDLYSFDTLREALAKIGTNFTYEGGV